MVFKKKIKKNYVTDGIIKKLNNESKQIKKYRLKKNHISRSFEHNIERSLNEMQ
jgi:hypothetical protein